MKRGMYNKLPRFVKLKNEKFVINADYRIFIEFEEEMQGNDINSAVGKALYSFYPAFSVIMEKDLLSEAVDKFIWFYFCGKEQLPETEEKGTGNKNKHVFSYEYDSDLIWGSFWIYARIDLSQGFLHWWKFKAIWNSLPEDCEFNKIKGYRGYDGNDKDLLKLKKHYKLPPTEAEIKEQIRKDKIYEAFK